MAHYECHIHLDEDQLRSESEQEDPTTGSTKKLAGWKEFRWKVWSRRKTATYCVFLLMPWP